MSDTILKSKIQALLHQSAYDKSVKLICPIVKILSMRYPYLSKNKIYTLTKSLV
ncbi:hypothetical protein [Sulfurimonas sediminis]|uniref:hypothetical protein n=1 Tax=Sulfurimonas sediminis TaxID=2590020 RepID=UPI001868795D|nr:hypothetical protein [Sulfurimonas sediminis]